MNRSILKWPHGFILYGATVAIFYSNNNNLKFVTHDKCSPCGQTDILHKHKITVDVTHSYKKIWQKNSEFFFSVCLWQDQRFLHHNCHNNSICWQGNPNQNYMALKNVLPPAKSLPYLRFAKGCSHFQSSLEPVAGIP